MNAVLTSLLFFAFLAFPMMLGASPRDGGKPVVTTLSEDACRKGEKCQPGTSKAKPISVSQDRYQELLREIRSLYQQDSELDQFQEDD